jgi:replicative DNA helicase
MVALTAFSGGVAQKSIEPTYRTPPRNTEAESALLGAIMVHNEAFDRVSDFLEPAHFSEELHGRIYDVMRTLIRAGKVATPITIKSFLPEADLGGLTVPQYLIRLAADATTIINAADYGRAIYEAALRRNLITIGEDIVNRAFDAPASDTPRTQIETAEQHLYKLAETGRYEGGFQTFTNALKTAIDVAAAAYKRDGNLSGVATGLSDLDFKMGGLQKSDLIIIAGRPGMGKTALATNIAYNVARAYKAGKAENGERLAIDGNLAWPRSKFGAEI